MERITTLFAAVTLLCLCAAAGSAQAPKELDPKVVEAWQKAGAQVGWYGRNQFSYWQFFGEKPNAPAALPAFNLGNFKPGVIANLPPPLVP